MDFSWGCAPTVKPYDNFHPTADAEALFGAMKGLGTNDKVIIDILTKRCNRQRREIALVYHQKYEKDFLKQLKKELSGDFRDVIIALVQRPAEYLCQELHDALKGITKLATDDDTLIEILCSRENKDVNKLCCVYKDLYGKSLSDSVASETRGDLKRFLMPIVSGNRKETREVNKDLAHKQAVELFAAGVAQWGTDEGVFVRIFSTENFEQLQQVFYEFKSLSGQSMQSVIEKEASGDVKKIMLTIVDCVECPAKYYAKRLQTAMKGIGTKDKMLIRTIVSRSEYDLAAIKKQYEQNHGGSLAKAVEKETGGNYKKTLLSIIG